MRMQLLMQYWCLATALEAEPQAHMSRLTYAALLNSLGFVLRSIPSYPRINGMGLVST
jgi:hypothetical protein